MSHHISRRTFVKQAGSATLALPMIGTRLSGEEPAKEARLDYDIVIYGGTSAGVIAAVQAARMERSVVLIAPTGRLGGLTSSGLSKTDIGDRETVGGLARRFYEYVGAVYGNDLQVRFEPHVAEQVFEQMIREASVPVIRHDRLKRPGGAAKQGARISSVTLESGRVVKGRVFLDATYVGDLMAEADVSYTVGRESGDTYGESLAGTLNSDKYVKTDLDPYVKAGDASSGLLPGIQSEQFPGEGRGDDRVQAYNYRLCLTKRKSNQVPLRQPEGYDPAAYELLARYFQKEPNLKLDDILLMGDLPHGKVDLNNWGYSAMSTDYVGGNYQYPEGSYDTRAGIERAHRRHIAGLLWFLGHDPRVPAPVRRQMRAWGYAADEFEQHNHWPPELYVREARRMLGPYVMTQADCEGKRTAKRPIALGSYNMDSHTVRRYVNDAGWMRKDGFFTRGSTRYPIGYDAITPRERECANLLVPVCLSASHAAFGSIRMEPVFMMLGQAAATAAAQAVQQEATVQTIDDEALRNRLLKDGQHLGEPAESRTIAAKALAGIVVDDTEADAVGHWQHSRNTGRYVGQSYRHDGHTQQRKEMRFRVPIPRSGRYQVRVSYSSHDNRASNALILIERADGWEEMRINQKREPAEARAFETLGTYHFPRGRTTIVISNKNADGYVIADAVQLLPASR